MKNPHFTNWATAGLINICAYSHNLRFLFTDNCGGTIIGASGLIQSPLYPTNYPNGADCEWFIQGPTGHFLHINFTQFQLSNQFQPDNCTGQDSLSFYNRDRFGNNINTQTFSFIDPALIHCADISKWNWPYQSQRSMQFPSNYCCVTLKPLLFILVIFEETWGWLQNICSSLYTFHQRVNQMLSLL